MKTIFVARWNDGEKAHLADRVELNLHAINRISEMYSQGYHQGELIHHIDDHCYTGWWHIEYEEESNG